jgi:hypothetical protein
MVDDDDDEIRCKRISNHGKSNSHSRIRQLSLSRNLHVPAERLMTEYREKGEKSTDVLIIHYRLSKGK